MKNTQKETRDVVAESVVTDEVTGSQSNLTSRSNLERASVQGRTKLTKADRVNKYLNLINRPPLEIPDEVRERFLREGYELRWIRYLTGKHGDVDLGNVSMKMQKGYSFVGAAELPEMNKDFIAARELKNFSQFGDIVTVNEMALAKIPTEDAEAYREALAVKTAQQSEGILASANSSRTLKKHLSIDPFA
jgi:hypothetical protein